MAGSVLFVSVVTIEGYLRPGYDARSMFVSELSLGPRGWIQIVNFIATGLLVLLFTRGVAAELRAGRTREARLWPSLAMALGRAELPSGRRGARCECDEYADGRGPRGLHVLAKRLGDGFQSVDGRS